MLFRSHINFTAVILLLKGVLLKVVYYNLKGAMTSVRYCFVLSRCYIGKSEWRKTFVLLSITTKFSHAIFQLLNANCNCEYLNCLDVLAVFSLEFPCVKYCQKSDIIITDGIWCTYIAFIFN